MRNVDCLIISTGRAASTATYQYLNEMANLNLPKNKEPHHWCDISRYSRRHPLLERIYVEDKRDYEKLYRDSRLLVDASVGYFFCIDEVIRRLERVDQSPRILFLYREPVTRAASLFYELRRKALEPASSIEEALVEESEKPEGMWWERYYDNVDYARVYRRITQSFDEILPIDYSDFSASPASAMHEILAFLELRKLRDVDLRPVNSSQWAVVDRKMRVLRPFKRFLPKSWKARARSLVDKHWKLPEESPHLETLLPRSMTEYRVLKSVLSQSFNSPRGRPTNA